MRNGLATKGLLLSVIALLLFAPLQIASADSGSLGITPAYPRADNARTKNIFIHSIKAGASATDGLRIINSGKETRVVQVRVVDEGNAVDGSFSCKQDSEARKEMGKWVTLETKEVTLEPQSAQVVAFTINVPAGASPGEHGGCITVQDNKDFAAKTGGGIQLGFRSAVRIAVTVPGKIVKQLTISRVDVKKVRGGEYQVSTYATNTGNVSLDVKAYAQLVSLFGQQTEIKSSDGTFPVMRDSTTYYSLNFKQKFWGGLYKARTSLNYNDNPSDGLGVNPSSTRKIRYETAYFFMLPVWQGIVIELAVLSLIIAGGVIFILRKYRTKHTQKKWQPYAVKQGETVVSLAAERKISWRRVAKINKLKAPYLLQEGQMLLLPSLGEWLVEETPEKEPEADETPIGVTKTISSAPAAANARRVEKASEVDETTPSPVHAWISPREYGGPSFDEYGEPIPDWREGADESEIEKIEHIDGASFASQYKNVWEDEADAAPKKRTPKRTSNGSKTKKPAASKKKPVKKATKGPK